MKIFRSSLEVPRAEKTGSKQRVLALGNFDGFHRGHQALLSSLQRLGLREQAECWLMTFEPHPREFLQNKSLQNSPWLRIWGRWDLENFLKNQNMAGLIEQKFDLEFSQTAAADFLEIYIKPLQLKGLVVGHDFAFGHHREGSLQLLENFCKQCKIDLEVIEAVEYGGQRVSTTQIKKLLSLPDLKEARSALGHWPSLGGVVVKGQQRGRTIGVPTANLSVEIQPALAQGVYVAMVDWNENSTKSIQHCKGVANLGLNPTVSDTRQVKLEVHLFDFSGDLYGQELRIEFRKFLRAEKKFTNFEELKKQIHLDLSEGHAIDLSDTVTEGLK